MPPGSGPSARESGARGGGSAARSGAFGGRGVRGCAAHGSRPSSTPLSWKLRKRIVAAIDAVLAAHTGGDILFVGHGAVGTLNLCRLLSVPIARALDQPGGGGNVYAWEAASGRVLHRWRRIEDEIAAGS